MSYRVSGLDPTPFRHLYGLSDAALAAHGARRRIADAKPGYPDRVELRDAEPGERVILLNYEHQPAATPFRASHAIFVLEGAERAASVQDEIPEPLRSRPISLRAFDATGDMLNAELAHGGALDPVIQRLLADPGVAYLHAHYAAWGCYAARIDRD